MAALLALTTLTIACTATPAVSPTVVPTASPVGKIGSLDAVTTTLLRPYGTDLILGPNANDPAYPESVTMFSFSDEWEFDPATDRYGWGRSVDGYVGAGATVERIAAALFDERVLGSAVTCASLAPENLEIAALQDVSSAIVLGHAGMRFTEAYGDGFLLGACADLDGGAVLLVRVPDPFYITTADGVSTPAAETLRTVLLGAADPFGS